MPTRPLSDDELAQAWRTVHECGGNKEEAARRLDIKSNTLRNRLERAVERFGEAISVPHVKGRKNALPAERRKLPRKGAVARYICTSAQTNTLIHAEVWRNLTALARHYGAELLVSTFNYNKATYGARSVKPGKGPTVKDMHADPVPPKEVRPYIADRRIVLAPGLVWCGEIQILPTQQWPLTGYEFYTGRKSSIIPHTSVQMVSVPSAKFEATKLLYTTGTVTQRNYVARSAGFKAEINHSYGGLLVEVDHRGHWWCRQLHAGPAAEIYDLDRCARAGRVRRCRRSAETFVEAITWGDDHPQRLDAEVARLAYGKGGMLDALRPRLQFHHDTLDFQTRSHWTRRDPHEMFRLYCCGRENVEEEFVRSAAFLKSTHRPWCTNYVVNSNHNRHLQRWLAEADWRHDPVNALIFTEMNLAFLRALAAGDKAFDPCAHALRSRGAPADIVFLKRDESLVICKGIDPGSTVPYAESGIECGMHGDEGPNGTRGNPYAFAKMGRRINVADRHSCGIYHGVYYAGHSAAIDAGFPHGPNSHTHSHTVTYVNGTRAIVTMWGGGWRAEGKRVAR